MRDLNPRPFASETKALPLRQPSNRCYLTRPTLKNHFQKMRHSQLVESLRSSCTRQPTQHHDVVCAPSHKTHNIIISKTNINIIFEADAYARDPNPEA